MLISRIGSLFVSQTFGSQNVFTIVPPKNNLRGLVIRTATLSAGGGFINLYADVVAPASVSDLTVRCIATTVGEHQIPYPLYLDPGNGVFIACGTGSSLNLTYDLVTEAPTQLD